MEPSDADLLAEFQSSESDAAFAQIVRRYAGLVYAAALRQVGDPHLAEDVAQAAFLVLVRRASTVSPPHLAGWLLNTTRWCARDANKRRLRRLRHESRAAMSRPTIASSSATPWPSEASTGDLAVHLDWAIARLADREQTALALRFLQGRPLTEVAAAMQITTDAAQKIIARALPKLRRMLTGKGTTFPSVAALSGALEQFRAPPAPPAVAAFHLAHGSSTSIQLANGAIKAMNGTAIKLAAAVAAVVVLGGVTGISILAHAPAAAEPPQPQAAQASPASADAAPTPPPTVPALQAPTSPNSPFIELVGCRIRQTLDLKLSVAPGAQSPRAQWIDWQYPLVRWTVDPAIGTPGGFTLTLASKDDPTDIHRLVLPKDAREQSLASLLISPGQYSVTLTADGSTGQPAIAHASITLAPLPDTQIMLNDIQPDRSIRFLLVMQYLNESDSELRTVSMTTNNNFRIESMHNADGNPLRYTTHDILSRGQVPSTRFTIMLQPPAQPGEPVEGSAGGVATGLIRQLPDGSFAYRFDHAPGGNEGSRRVELFLLPSGAQLISTQPDLPHRLVDGRIQIFVDTFIPKGGHNPVAFHYRLPGGDGGSS